jgi:hypothetical protein
MRWTQDSLISLFHVWEQKNGDWPTKKQWTEDSTLPSDMPIRVNFGDWTSFVKACGKEPRRSEISIQARLSSIKARTGEKGGNNKGGRYMDKWGYVQMWKPEHPNCKSAGYIHEHRYLMSEKLGRPLRAGENIHHINGIRHDNRIENLELWTTQQPAGQRVDDKIEWAKSFLESYGYEIIGNIHTKADRLEGEG